MTRAARDRDQATAGRRVIALAAVAAAPGNHRSIVAKRDTVTAAARNRDQ
eukprot:CAMPEP_0118910682 /NCGR_PEP_ID=MMETSP1166-20130328/12713_1 /TAXON_ID=1104430 /ORGANISM="Chrysoreinhardia sp, Strain CCMP3193" /LENGTH=49 /DNA_ID= /DNA_START= /DNA_END= /DNA_ORIENTATION=